MRTSKPKPAQLPAVAPSTTPDSPPDSPPDNQPEIQPESQPETGASAADGDAGVADPRQFETALAELEALVDRLEQGDLTLEESLAAFERGVGLTRACQRALDQAEQRVRILTDSDPNAEPEPFVPAGLRPPA